MTRIMTGQVVDVRLHLLRRLAAEARTLLGWRERAKGAVLTLGGLVRASHRVLGERLTARGLLHDPLDVDLLFDAELRGDAPPPSAAVVGRRRRAVERMTAGGSLPERFTGVPEAERPPMPSGDRLTGIGASAGRRTARARVVRDPLHAKLRAGEVLVAETTDAGWSPLFVEAGAIVVERGGPLSHAAIVARELGVPAVLDVHGATAALDGRMVTVDGDDGVVIIHGEGRP
jgi:pyruvate,water dikinase